MKQILKIVLRTPGKMKSGRGGQNFKSFKFYFFCSLAPVHGKKNKNQLFTDESYNSSAAAVVENANNEKETSARATSNTHKNIVTEKELTASSRRVNARR